MFGLLSFNVNAQNLPTSIDIKQAIELGVKNNQSVEASVLETTMQKQLLKSAFELPKTEFSGMFGQINSNAKDKNLSVNQGFSPFQIGAKRKLLQEYNKASQSRLGATKQDITFDIRKAWNAMLFYEKQNRVLEKQNVILQRFVKSAEIKFQTGESNSLEKTIAIAKQQELEQSIKQNKTQIEVEKSNLKALLNLKSDFTASDTTFIPLPFVTKADSTLIKQNPALQLANNQVQIAQANHRVQKSSLYPDFSIGYFMQSLTGNQDVNGQTVYYDNSPRFTGFSVGFSLPLFAGSGIAKSKAAKTSIEVEKKNAEYLETQLKSQFEQQLEQLNTFQSLIEYYVATANPNANLIIKNATKGYQNGDISYVEYVQSLETASNIQLNYNEAVNRYNQTVINIQYLTNQ